MASKRERDQKARRKTDASAWASEQGKGFESKSVKLPEGYEWYKLEIGTHTVDFMPFIVGNGNPRADKGFVHFEREYKVHRIPTPGGKQTKYCCLWENFGKTCPICQFMNNKGSSADQELIKSLRPQVRHLWLVNDKPGDKRNKVKIFDTNHYQKGIGFGEMIADAITAVRKYGSFADLEGGMSVQLTVKEQTMPGSKWNGVTRIDFIPRDYDYPDELLDELPCLDDMIIEPDPSELRKLIEQGSSDDSGDDREERPSPSRSTSRGVSVPDDDKDDDDEPDADEWKPKKGDVVKHETYGVCEVLKVSGKTITLEDEDQDEHICDLGSVSEVTDDEDEEEEKPAPKASGKKKVDPDEDEDEDDLEDEDELSEEEDEEEDDEEEDDPAPKGKKTSRK